MTLLVSILFAVISAGLIDRKMNARHKKSECIASLGLLSIYYDLSTANDRPRTTTATLGDSSPDGLQFTLS